MRIALVYVFVIPALKLKYSKHNPEGLAIPVELRVGLSKLNFHKFRHNFNYAVNPLCPANDRGEDTEQFATTRSSGNILLTYLKAFFIRNSSEYENVR